MNKLNPFWKDQRARGKTPEAASYWRAVKEAMMQFKQLSLQQHFAKTVDSNVKKQSNPMEEVAVAYVRYARNFTNYYEIILERIVQIL